MEILYLLIPISLGIVFVAIWIFIQMSKSGQFDDLEGPAYRILLDDDLPGAAARAGEQSAPGGITPQVGANSAKPAGSSPTEPRL